MIYDQHRAAFNQVSAYVVMHGADRVATVAIKYPRDGAGRLYAYVHWLGVPMVRGFAGGGGYDKRSAACASATRKLPESLPEGYDAAADVYAAFLATMRADGGLDWNSALTRAGFTVLQAV
jgi:hypothetical protein